jgi:hypothetical protein
MLNILADVMRELSCAGVDKNVQLSAAHLIVQGPNPALFLGARGFCVGGFVSKLSYSCCFDKEGYLREELRELGRQLYPEPITQHEFLAAMAVLISEPRTDARMITERLFAHECSHFDLVFRDWGPRNYDISSRDLHLSSYPLRPHGSIFYCKSQIKNSQGDILPQLNPMETSTGVLQADFNVTVGGRKTFHGV